MILLIDNYDSFTYNLYQSVAQHGVTVKVVRNDKITVSEVNALKPQGIILSPGPGRPENAGICIELIRALNTANINSVIPLLGVCLGHQAMAIALGGKVIQANEIMHGKSDFVFHHRTHLYQAVSMPFQAGRYHSLIVDRASLPEKLVIEAENANGLIMGMRHVSLPMYGVQFHPESILTPEGDSIVQQFIHQCMNSACEVPI